MSRPASKPVKIVAIAAAIALLLIGFYVYWYQNRFPGALVLTESDEQTAAALSATGTDAVPQLVEVFRTKRVESKQAPLGFRLFHPADSAVVLDDAQAMAAYRLKELGPKAASAAPAMIALLKDRDPGTRRWAAEIL